MKRVVKKIFLISSVIFLFFTVLLYIVSLYIKRTFTAVPFEQLLYSIKFREGTSPDVLKNGFHYVVPRFIAFIAMLLIIQYILKKIYTIFKNKTKLRIKIFKKKYIINAIFSLKTIKISLYIFMVIILIYKSFVYLGVFDYIKFQSQTTKIYEDYYVNPKSVNINFPEKKQNLIYIIVESLETAGLSRNNSGGSETSMTPKLEKLALENTNFSNNNSLGGAYAVAGLTYTAASLVGQTSGTPLKANFNGEDYYGYDNFYSGFYSIGEVLEKNGYKNYFIMGSDADFAGRKDYFTKHGNYKIMDYYYAIDHGWIKDNYKVWWGFEDKKLLKFAKQELKNISKNKEPFNFTILTADTHFYDGYMDKSCKDRPFNEQYANVYYCNDSMIYDFVDWIKHQDFYKDTTIILTGDHITMQNGFFEKYVYPGYQRTIYDVIINSKQSTNNYKNRLFTVMDLYPTTLSALGATIDGNQLGFGVNLYSDKQTLVEKLGVDYTNSELSKNSEYYNNYIVGKGYYNKLSE